MDGVDHGDVNIADMLRATLIHRQDVHNAF